MTVKKTISISDNLDNLIKEFDRRHPFEPLIISQIAQKAIFEKIKAADPELVAILTPGMQVAATSPVVAKEIVIEEDNVQRLKGEPQLIQVQKTEKPEKTTSGNEIECLNCGQKIMAQRSTRKFCSKGCTTAYGRKMKKLQS